MVNPVQFAAGVLRGIGAPVNPTNIAAFIGWSKAEGPLGGDSWARNNPLNTTMSTGGVTGTINSAGVKAYRDAEAGIQATVQTLRNGNYGGILQAFREANPGALGQAVAHSPWGTGALAIQTIDQTSPKEFNLSNLGNIQPTGPAAANRGGRPPGANVSPSIDTTQVGPQVNWQAAGQSVLQRALAQPINTSGAVTAGPNLLKELANAAPAFTTPAHSVITANGTVTTPATPAEQAGGGLNVPKGTSGTIMTAISAANRMAQNHYNYEWGGGHNPSFAPAHGVGHGSGVGTGYDCSGAVSAILHSVGLLNTPMVASQFMNFGAAGAGGKNDITIYASPTHVFMKLGGKYFGTSMSNKGGGAGWFANADTAGFVVRHVAL